LSDAFDVDFDLDSDADFDLDSDADFDSDREGHGFSRADSALSS
jgi:hypothetical protein